jgi:predicted glycosyltransferase
MKIIIDIGHPKDVNVFKNVMLTLKKNGHEVRIVGRAKENTKRILAEYGFYCEFGPYYENITGKVFGIIHNDIWLYKIAKEYKPDLFVSPGSPYAAHVSRLLGKPHLAYIDTEIATFAIKLMLPFTDRVYTSSSFYSELGPKQECFNGYYELAYLHPKYFKPNPEIPVKYGLNRYIILRLSALAAHHDINATGFNFKTDEELSKYVNELEKYGRVVISSEIRGWHTIESHRIEIEPKDLHDLISYSSLCIGEGATMASEAAVMGVPSIYVSNTQRGYLNELEIKYGLAYTVTRKDEALEKVAEILGNKSNRNKWSLKKR